MYNHYSIAQRDEQSGCVKKNSLHHFSPLPPCLESSPYTAYSLPVYLLSKLISTELAAFSFSVMKQGSYFLSQREIQNKAKLQH